MALALAREGTVSPARRPMLGMNDQQPSERRALGLRAPQPTPAPRCGDLSGSVSRHGRSRGRGSLLVLEGPEQCRHDQTPVALNVRRLSWSGSVALQRFAKPMQRYDYRRSVQRPAILGDRLDHFPCGLIDRIVFLNVDVQAVRPNGFRLQLRRAITPIRGSESNGCSSLS